ncbi:MAG: acVLRF1 family peptidyl-tRNA hydrolase [Actinocatenispora sp.]
MSRKARPAAGGGRWVEVAPERLGRWLSGFAGQHGEPAVAGRDDGLLLTAPDGSRAECQLPLGWPGDPGEDVAALVAASRHDWHVGIVLARRGAHAVGSVLGQRLLASKVDTRYVQGRTAAGGWSQQRFARRRDNQTRESIGAAVEHAARVLDPVRSALAGLVTGGDRALLDAVLADRRLGWLAALPRVVLPDVPEPRHATLVEAGERYRMVRIKVVDPEPTSES